MPINLDEVVPWGRSFDEYVAMFALTDADLRSRIVGCGDGPAAFNAIGTRRGARIVSVDPLYQFEAEAISARVDETRHIVVEQLRANRSDYVWTSFPSVERLEHARLSAMESFLEDYADGLDVGRYVAGSLPGLPLAGAGFDLALCSHFLFLYSAHHDLAFHLAALREMLRVANEVRVFPLLTLAGTVSPYLEDTMQVLRSEGCFVEICRVNYEFQRGGNEMLRVVGARADGR